MTGSAGLVIVPPFECAWLQDPEFVFKRERGCLTFEVKGENDATILLKPQPGSRRWQHLSAVPRTESGSHADSVRGVVESNYTIILGSHRNSCLKIEKNGELCCMATHLPEGCLSPESFVRFWISYDAGSIVVGRGEPGRRSFFCWKDAHAVPGIAYAGLSSWDKHMAYRGIKVLPTSFAVSSPAPSSPDKESRQLQDLCGQVLASSLSPATVCGVLRACELLDPAQPELAVAARDYASRHLGGVLSRDPGGLAGLGASTLADLLRAPSMDCSEEQVFRALVLWAQGGLDDEGGDGMGLEDDDPVWGVDGTGKTDSDPSTLFSDSPPSSPRPERTFILRRPPDTLSALLPLVRFPLMSPAALERAAQHPVARACPVLLELVAEARAVGLGDLGAAGSALAGEGGGADLTGGSSGAAGGLGRDFFAQPSSSDASLSSSPVQGIVASVLELEEGGPGAGPASEPSPSGAEAGAPTPPPSRKSLLVPPPAAEARLERLRGRAPPGGVELVFVHGGDRNGLFAWLGSHGGRRPWVNPVDAQEVRVTASSPLSRLTSARALVGGASSHSNFAGPRREGGVAASSSPGGASAKLASWWAVDLGPRRRLALTHYALRHDASRDFLRDWAVQASADGETWVDVRRHSADPALKVAHQWAAWPLVGHAAARPWRALRVLLDRPNAGADNPWHLALSAWEFYGHLYDEHGPFA